MSDTKLGFDGGLSDALVASRRFFTRNQVSGDLRTLTAEGGREGDVFYRDRWSHDKVVRSTHGVNCTGSCSWKVYVKDGIITWEAQQTDYPSTGADRPEYEPRGCPRGAAFSWYTYSPTRVRYPYVRGVLLEMFRAAVAEHGDPVVAWASIMQDPEKTRAYKAARGKGGLVRATWAEAAEMVAAAHVYTVKRWGPDRIAGFSPIPAMSPVSFASGSRFLELIGAPMLSFYDWYADLPNASPQMFGDQTDVPESGDWWDAAYLVMWGSNVPLTRTPDAHWMTEARYRGQKVLAVAPDYADNVKFADEWVSPAPGTDGALAMGMGHVVLREYFVERQVPFFTDYNKSYTDLPYLITLDAGTDGAYRPGKFLVAGDLEHPEGGTENTMWKPAVMDAATGRVRIPKGSVGHRYGEEGLGQWNLERGDIDPLLTLYPAAGADSLLEAVEVALPRFDDAGGKVRFDRRGVPVARVGDRLVTTVLDLLLAQYGVSRPGLPGQWPQGYDDPSVPATPAWQEQHTGVPAAQVTRLGREWAQNAIDTEGRGMILLGAGVNHWFHSDQIYRAILLLTTITGTQGRNGGGWAHYVGQEKVRPLTGFQHMAFALDWHRPPRHMNQTAYWYVNTSQYRYDTFSADDLDAGTGIFAGRSVMDLLAQSVRLGWTPSYPTFDRSSLNLADDAAAAGMEAPAYVAQQLKEGALKFAVEDPEHEDNHPRILNLWRSNLLGSSAKGNEYFLRHLLGTDSAARAKEAPPDKRPTSVRWAEEAPQGKLDLLMTIDFRMTSSTIFSDVVLPAATWYEKHDLSTTDMHPFVHSFNPAIAPPWETKSDWDAWKAIAKRFSELAVDHLGVRRDVVAKPLWHDTPEAMSSEHGVVKDWRLGPDHPQGCDPVPGRTMPVIAVAERDYTQVHEKMTSIGPLLESAGMATKGVAFQARREVEILRHRNGVTRGGAGDGQPKVETDVQMADAMLHLAGVSNGHLATQGFRFLEKRTGVQLHDLSAEHEGKQITFADTQVAPVPVITSPEWSGSESGGRRYSPFTINIERRKPFHTLTGRQQFYIDHDWFIGMGESLPVYRPPLDMTALFGEAPVGEQNELGVSVRYLTPHNKWSIHSEYQDNLFMLSLSRGGQAVWMSDRDAAKVGIRDNDWIEMVNRNGVVAARAIVSHRMPEGTVYMHHAQDRLIDVPRTERDGKRGGIHNSLTRILMKPNHIVGGYAQLAYAFNYIGPIGDNRDEVTMIRKRRTEVTY
ncbi:nitrate reductase subunit alpha [Nocardioides sp. zg-ZUI104]|uniref:nitrate reductase subunit alpha n=1 Tax=Nocardioides faecalis TaxID=2803858 RepID=UPI001BCF1B7C|nr:nitrate reductase subunit alpha [Nocardioides faecalis]MBS4751678.1 nitrate reductase subunit alpha [Nocardioides faecalis]